MYIRNVALQVWLLMSLVMELQQVLLNAQAMISLAISASQTMEMMESGCPMSSWPQKSGLTNICF